MSNLFSELKRRNVFRVVGVYAVVGWLMAQIAALSATSFGAPDWVMKMVIVALLIGVPIAMVFAWAFEMTPDGVKRTESVDAEDSIVDKTGRKLDFAILAGLGLVAALAIFQISRPNIPVTTTASEQGKSIAVLPFVNMSSDKEQEYFADGISEEILNVLVRIPDLKVAGRTSSFSFKNKNEDLRIIGEALDVNHILEGSVRRSGAKLRITAQLIRSDDGFHLWSDTYDRELADIFDIQDEIAKEVADQLAISMGLDIQHKVHERTTDLVAYENYLKARQLFLMRGRENLDEALALLDDATTRDPDFAPAWTLIGNIYSIYQSYASQEEYQANNEQWNDLGKKASLKALSLDPTSAEALALLGVPYYYDFDFIKAFEYYDKALALAPNNPVILDIMAQASLDVGYLNEAEAHSKKAITLDPLVSLYRNTLGWAQYSRGDLESSRLNFEKSIELNPGLRFAHWNKISLYFNPAEIDKVPDLVENAVSSGAFMDQDMEAAELIAKFVANRKRMTDEEAMQVFSQTVHGIVFVFEAQYFEDVDKWVSSRQATRWNQYSRQTPDLFSLLIPGVYANEAWKAQVRKDGILALWQSRGFPAHCRPLEGDDFECDDFQGNWNK